MIRHILIVAWRNICKYKVSAGIAVVGLAMGLLCFVLCNFCARLFFSIDKVFPNYDRMAEIQIKVGEDLIYRKEQTGTKITQYKTE